ncbi:MAG: D-2-hydroxyacid dehydrogenase [Xanthomonadales bacterium]|nr:D-2-hydroxyacid dehydrogenase [Xanthomonadales bacterium]
MPEILILSKDAPALAAELERQSGFPVPFRACTSSDQALDQYDGEKILFGRPDLIAACLPAWPAVEWVQSSWAGVEPLLAIDRRDYHLTVVKDVFGQQMSEYVLGHLLAHELKLSKRRAHQEARDWFQEPSGTLGGKHMGIMGTGSIGRHIARVARSIGLTVSGLSRSGKPAEGFDSVHALTQFEAWLHGLDYLVSTLPGTPKTSRLLDARSLARLPAHCYMVNVGRSNVLDEAALVEALTNNKLAGAALDVFDTEPLPQDSPLWETPNLTITAHISAVSHPSLIVPIFLENLHRFRDGQALKFLVDFDAGY